MWCPARGCGFESRALRSFVTVTYVNLKDVGGYRLFMSVVPRTIKKNLKQISMAMARRDARYPSKIANVRDVELPHVAKVFRQTKDKEVPGGVRHEISRHQAQHFAIGTQAEPGKSGWSAIEVASSCTLQRARDEIALFAG